ncbi:hypothetical protein NS220_02245 [Microbacterium testaceum]|uniref:Uncharacterized protein n=1 Tax=Microbacterium testaceum TaxID=2033 RepID=A0A147F1B4_MICTE|nr:hypothetical protein [Microbacterium testaceum]KTR96358.1 hypothetical protein NS220_02245 [Microbacterium testaceum]
MRSDWITHRRPDGEVLGWMEPSGDGFVVIDLLGRRATEAVDWLTAEETLEERGIGYLADMYELRLDDGSWLRVRIAEVSTSGIRVKKEDWGAIGASQLFYDLAFPVDEEVLRPLG